MGGFNKVVGGTSNTTLSPSGTATRAQIAVIQIRYLENVVGATFPEVTPSQPETKPEQGDATTVPSDVNAYIKTLPETVQSGIALVYDDLYFSDPAEIQAAGIGRERISRHLAIRQRPTRMVTTRNAPSTFPAQYWITMVWLF